MKACVLKILESEFSICHLDNRNEIPQWLKTAKIFSVTRTKDELSVVCPTSLVPAGVESSSGWSCIEVKGPLSFDQVGILASIASPLARAGISIFVISTYLTDYILVRKKQLKAAISTLKQAGHTVVSPRKVTISDSEDTSG